MDISEALSFEHHLVPAWLDYKRGAPVVSTEWIPVDDSLALPQPSLAWLSPEGLLQPVEFKPVEPTVSTLAIFPSTSPYAAPALITEIGYNWPNLESLVFSQEQLSLFSDYQVRSTEILRKFFQKLSEFGERARREVRNRIRTAAVSMSGHLSFLIAIYRKICLEADAEDAVTHLEPLALSKLKVKANSDPTTIQNLLFGEGTWDSFLQSLKHLEWLLQAKLAAR